MELGQIMISEYLVGENDTIADALKRIDETGKRCVFVVDDVGKLVAALADGDVQMCIRDRVDLWGDPTKAKTVLGWDPQKTTCEELCRIMVEHDLEQAKREAKFNS